MKTTQTLITALFSGAHALVADPTGTASTSVVNPGAEDPALDESFTMKNPGWSELPAETDFTGIVRGNAQYPAAW